MIKNRKNFLVGLLVLLMVGMAGAGMWQASSFVLDCYGSLTIEALVDAMGQQFTRVRGNDCVLAQETPPMGSTSSPTATSTMIATSTATRPGPASPTPTPTGMIAATPTQIAGEGCPVHENAWHPPMDLVCMHHHHGWNPRGNAPSGQSFASIFSVDGFNLDEYLDTQGTLWQPWLTSPGEEKEGMIWLYFEDGGCTQFAPASNPEEFADYDCVVAALIRIHDDGRTAHFLKRFHSETFVIKGCEKLPNGLPNLNVCGIIASGDHHDYGIVEAPYKTLQCPIPGVDPAGFFDLNQPPYRAHTILDPQRPNPDKVVQFWSGQPPNPINNPNNMYYPHGPNHLIGFGWSSVDAWQLFDNSICETVSGDQLTYEQIIAAAEAFPLVPGMQHITFQIFNLNVQAHPAGPFTGWTDQYGHVWPTGEPDGGCTEASSSCIPLIITENFPDRKLMMQERVDQGNCSFTPCITVPTFGVQMIYPPHDVP